MTLTLTTFCVSGRSTLYRLYIYVYIKFDMFNFYRGTQRLCGNFHLCKDFELDNFVVPLTTHSNFGGVFTKSLLTIDPKQGSLLLELIHDVTICQHGRTHWRYWISVWLLINGRLNSSNKISMMETEYLIVLLLKLPTFRHLLYFGNFNSLSSLAYLFILSTETTETQTSKVLSLTFQAVIYTLVIGVLTGPFDVTIRPLESLCQ